MSVITITSEIGTTGRMLAFIFDAGATFWTSQVTDPTIRITPHLGVPGDPIMLSGRITTIKASMVVYPLPITVLSNDTVDFSAPSGWVSGTPIGGSLISAPAAVFQVINHNYAGGDMGLVVGTPSTLRMGINQYGMTSGWPTQVLRNLAKNAGAVPGAWAGTATALDQYGNVATQTTGTNKHSIILKGNPDSLHINTLGTPGTPGTYRTVWDDYNVSKPSTGLTITAGTTTGAKSIVTSLGAATIPASTTTDLSGTYWKDCYQDFDVAFFSATDQSLAISVTMANINVKNARVYGPGSSNDPLDLTVTDGYFKAKFAGTGPIRFQEASSAQSGSAVALSRHQRDSRDVTGFWQHNTLGQFPDQVDFNYVEPIGAGTVTYAGVDYPIVDRTTAFDSNVGLYFRVHCATNHPFYTGQGIILTSRGNQTLAIVNNDFTNPDGSGKRNGIMGNSVPNKWAVVGVASIYFVVATTANTFDIATGLTGGTAGGNSPQASPPAAAGVAGTQSITGTAWAIYPQVHTLSHDQMVRIGYEMDTDIFVNLAQPLTDAGFTAVGVELLAAVQATGYTHNIYVDWGNEVWNSSYFGYKWTAAMSKIIGGGMTQNTMYALHCSRAHTLIKQAFTDGGGDPAQIKSLFAAQFGQGNSAVGTAIIDYCFAHGITLDALAEAPYMDTPLFMAASCFDACDVDQVFDYHEWGLSYNKQFTSATTEAYLHTKFPAAEYVGYEGGTVGTIPGSTGTGTITAHRLQLSYDFVYHPRHYRLLMLIFTKCQDQWNFDWIAKYNISDGSANTRQGWSTVYWNGQEPWDKTLGHGGLGGSANVSILSLAAGQNIHRLNTSVGLRAWQDWNNALGPPPAAPTITVVNPVTGYAAGGETITITGTDLTTTSAVYFGLTAAPYSVTSSTTVSATAPAHAAALVDITVTTRGGTSATGAADHYTYTPTPTPGPVVTSISPSTGDQAGATDIVITGTAFTTATAVSFGAVPAAAFTVTNSTHIAATSPIHPVGVVDVRVTTPAGISDLVAGDQFTYTATPPAPTVLSGTPAILLAGM